MSNTESRDSLLSLTEEQIGQGRRLAAHASLLGAYLCSPGDPEIVGRICGLLAELESPQSAASFALRDARIQWDMVRPDDVDDPNNLFDAQLYDSTADFISSDWETGRDKNENLISKVWEIVGAAADQLARLQQRFPNEITAWARRTAHPQRETINTRAVGLFLARLGDHACVDCLLPDDHELNMLMLPDEHAWGCGFVEELRQRFAALEVYCEKNAGPIWDSRILGFAVLCLNWPHRNELNIINAVEPILPYFGIKAIETIVATSRGEIVWPGGKVLRFNPQWVELVANVIRDFPAISGAGQLRLIAETGPFALRAAAAELLRVVEHGPTKIDWSSDYPD